MQYTLEHPSRQALARKIPEAALALARAGFRVVPLQPDTKRPAIRRWQSKATRDPRRIPALFPEGVPFNLGVHIEAPRVAVDIDPRNGGEESFAKLTEEYGHPPATATALTGGGGWHLVYDTPVPIRTRLGFRPGIDILGAGSLLTVAPSRHPDTRRHYDWQRHPSEGIALLPDWLAALITGEERPRIEGGARPIACDRTAAPGELAADVIARFPVEASGRRHPQMCRAVGRLLGLGYRPDAVREAMEAWHVHFLHLGTTRTSVADGMVEVEATIRATIGNPRFQAVVGLVDHRRAMSEIRLSEEQERLIRSGPIAWPASSGVGLGPGCPDPPWTPPCIRLTAPAQTPSEIAFVEAILVCTIYKIELGEHAEAGVIRATDKQLQEIAADRHPGLKWAPPQVERLKCKYINRPGDNKPALRLELWREVKKGERRPGQSAGSPSEYLLTGVLALLGKGATLVPAGSADGSAA